MAANRTTAYLHPTDVQDARALWVNPAGLGVLQEASVHLDVTVGDPGASARLRQLTLDVTSRGLSFGYQRDVFDGGVRGHTYRVGFAAGHGGLAAGVAAALYRGDTQQTGWDLGVVYAPGPMLSVGGVIANLGQPVVRGLRQPVTYVYGATVRPFGAHAALSVDGRVTAQAAHGYAFAGRWSSSSRTGIGIIARVDTDRSFRRAAIALGLSLGGQDVVGVVATTPGDANRVDAVSLYGVSTRPVGR